MQLLIRHQIFFLFLSSNVLISVVDPNKLNLDPYPGFWPNLDPDLVWDPGPDPDPGLNYQF